VLHEAYTWMRKLRNARGWSLTSAEQQMQRAGTSVYAAITIGSYERGDRNATVDVAEEILRFYGYRLAVVPLETEPGLAPAEETERLIATINRCTQRLRQLWGDPALAARDQAEQLIGLLDPTLAE